MWYLRLMFQVLKRPQDFLNIVLKALYCRENKILITLPHTSCSHDQTIVVYPFNCCLVMGPRSQCRWSIQLAADEHTNITRHLPWYKCTHSVCCSGKNRRGKTLSAKRLFLFVLYLSNKLKHRFHSVELCQGRFLQFDCLLYGLTKQTLSFIAPHSNYDNDYTQFKK